MILPLLAACRTPPPECPVGEGWEPVLTEELRVSEADTGWEAEDAAVLDAAATEGCGEPPCLAVTGPGAGRIDTLLNRGLPHTVAGTLSATGTARFVVRLTAQSGVTQDLVTVQVAGGSETFSVPFTLDAPGSEVALRVEADDGVATLDGLALSAETWAAVEDPPGGPLLLGFLMHVEQDGKLESDPEHWALRAAVVEGVSRTLAAHGARLGFQPDATFVRGSAGVDAGWMDARVAEGAGFSAHIHAETHEEGNAVEQAVRDARGSFRELGFDVTDLNGGFNTGQWSTVEDAGIRSLTAFKDPESQIGLARSFVNPWRPPDGSTYADQAAFTTPDPEGPVVYLPGSPLKEVDHARYAGFVARVLSQAAAHAREGWINTWYFVIHIDQFGPADDEGLAVYLADGSFESDLSEYDRMLTESTDPLVASGGVEYAVPTDMARAWLAWEEVCLGR